MIHIADRNGPASTSKRSGGLTRKVSGVLSVAALSVVALAAPAWAGPTSMVPARPGQYHIVNLGNLPGSTGGGAATALNDRGEVVGYSGTAQGQAHPFLWKDGVMTDLGALERSPGNYGVAIAINNRGEVVGVSDIANGTTQRAFVWRRGVMTDLGTLGGTVAVAQGINDRGQVVGTSETASGEWHGFLWENGHMTDLNVDTAGAINDRGQIVGATNLASGYHAYRWYRGHLTDLGAVGGTYSQPSAMNGAGWVVGVSGNTSSPGYAGAFLWRDGTMTELPGLGGLTATADAVNDRGQVLGTAMDPTFVTHHVIWQNGSTIDLATRGLPPGTMGSGVGGLSDINNAGQIAGAYYFQEGQPGPALFRL